MHDQIKYKSNLQGSLYEGADEMNIQKYQALVKTVEYGRFWISKAPG